MLKKVSIEILRKNSIGKSVAEIKGPRLVLRKGFSERRQNNFRCKTKPCVKISSDNTKENADSIFENLSSVLNVKHRSSRDDHENIDKIIKACATKSKSRSKFSITKKKHTPTSSGISDEDTDSSYRNSCTASYIEDRSNRVLPFDSHEELNDSMKVCVSKLKTGRLFSRRKSYNSNATADFTSSDNEFAPSKSNSNVMKPRSITNPKKENKIKMQLSRLKPMCRMATWQSNKMAKDRYSISPDVKSSADTKNTEDEIQSNDETSISQVGGFRIDSLVTKSTNSDFKKASMSNCDGLTRVRANLPFSENCCTPDNHALL